MKSRCLLVCLGMCARSEKHAKFESKLDNWMDLTQITVQITYKLRSQSIVTRIKTHKVSNYIISLHVFQTICVDSCFNSGSRSVAQGHSVFQLWVSRTLGMCQIFNFGGPKPLRSAFVFNFAGPSDVFSIFPGNAKAFPELISLKFYVFVQRSWRVSNSSLRQCYTRKAPFVAA